MPKQKPTLQEFEFRGNVLVHLPTGATWTMIPGSNKPRSFKPSKLGVTLIDGNFYLEDEVRKLAMILIVNPPPKEIEVKKDRRWHHGSYS